MEEEASANFRFLAFFLLVGDSLLAEPGEELHDLLFKLLAALRTVQTVRVRLTEVNHVNVSLVDRVEVSHLGVGPVRHRTVDASDGDPVTRLDAVHQLAVDVEHHGVRGLTGRHVVRRLLQFDHLLVSELGPVVDQGEAVAGVALAAQGRLQDPPSLDLNLEISAV